LAVPGQHAADHTNEREAINAIVAELGVAPQGAYATVQARITAIETRLTTWDGGTGHVPTVSDSAGYPFDFSSLPGLSAADEIQGWTVMDLTARGLWERSLVLQKVESDVELWVSAYAYNLDDTRQFIKWNRYFGRAGYKSLAHDWAINRDGHLASITEDGFYAVGNLSTDWLALENNVFRDAPVKLADKYWSVGKQPNGTYGLIGFDPQVVGLIKQSPFTFASGAADAVEIAASGSNIWTRTSKNSSSTYNEQLEAYTRLYTYYVTPLSSDGSFGQTTTFTKRHIQGRMLSTGDGDALLACELSPGTLANKLQLNRLTTSDVLTPLFEIPRPMSSNPVFGISHGGGRNIIHFDEGFGASRLLVVTFKGFREVATNAQRATGNGGSPVTWGLNNDATTVRFVSGSQLMEKRLSI
jgi:hypothetical protein